jgi:hypothetical protein
MVAPWKACVILKRATVNPESIGRGFAPVDVANSRNSPAFAQAEKALSTLTALLPRIGGLSDHDRLRIEAKVTELRAGLERVPVYTVRSRCVVGVAVHGGAAVSRHLGSG